MAENGNIYVRQIDEGARALPGARCPYPIETEIGARCSWLAGHHDAHGLEAWAVARSNFADKPALWEEDRGN